MQFQSAQKHLIASGHLTRSYRNWKRRQVRPGGRYPIHPVGFIRVTSVEQVPTATLTEAEARAAGHNSLGRLHALLRGEQGLPATVWAIEFAFDGTDNPDAPVTAVSDDQQVAQLRMKLNAMETRSKSGPWAWAALGLIAANPECRAGDLAPQLGMERDDFKVRVRRLKKLGLTHSLETGYRISDLGAACLAVRQT